MLIREAADEVSTNRRDAVFMLPTTGCISSSPVAWFMLQEVKQNAI